MSHLDDALQFFRDKLGIKSNSQLDDEERNRSAYLHGGPSAYPGGDVQLPTINMARDSGPMGPPREDVIADRFPQEAMLNTLQRAESDNRVFDNPGMPSRFEAGPHPDEDVYFDRQGTMMTPQQTQDYIDFISPHQFDDEADLPPVALAAMRRRGR